MRRREQREESTIAGHACEPRQRCSGDDRIDAQQDPSEDELLDAAAPRARRARSRWRGRPDPPRTRSRRRGPGLGGGSKPSVVGRSPVAVVVRPRGREQHETEPALTANDRNVPLRRQPECGPQPRPVPSGQERDDRDLHEVERRQNEHTNQDSACLRHKREGLETEQEVAGDDRRKQHEQRRPRRRRGPRPPGPPRVALGVAPRDAVAPRDLALGRLLAPLLSWSPSLRRSCGAASPLRESPPRPSGPIALPAVHRRPRPGCERAGVAHSDALQAPRARLPVDEEVRRPWAGSPWEHRPRRTCRTACSALRRR